MSGPKVVRVLTREERMALSLKLLNALRNAIARYEEQSPRDDGLTAHEVLIFQQQMQILAEKVHAANQFTDLERAINAEISFIRDKQEDALQAMIATRCRERLHSYTTTYMQEYLREQEKEQLRFHADAQSAMPLTEEQKKILNQILEPSDTGTLEAWNVASQAIPESVTLLERTMAELEILHAPTAQTFTARMADIHGQAHGQKRDMQRDSLLMELASAVKEQKKIEHLIIDLENLASQRDVGASITQAVKRTIKARDFAKMQQLYKQITSLLKAVEDEEFATMRRKAIFEGLAELGYGKGAEMATCVEKEGRIVLRENVQSAYGIEIAGASSPRMQVRVVSFSEKHDPEADGKAESVWCGHVAALQENVRQRGIEVIIDMARKVGEVPLKKILLQETDRAATQNKTLNTSR